MLFFLSFLRVRIKGSNKNNRKYMRTSLHIEVNYCNMTIIMIIVIVVLAAAVAVTTTTILMLSMIIIENKNNIRSYASSCLMKT